MYTNNKPCSSITKAVSFSSLAAEIIKALVIVGISANPIPVNKRRAKKRIRIIILLLNRIIYID